MKEHVRSWILSCISVCMFASAYSQEVFSAWASPEGHYSTERNPALLCALGLCPAFANPEYVADADLSNAAVINFPVLSVLGSASVTMELTQMVTGKIGGIKVSSATNLAVLTLLPSLEVALINNNTVVASNTYATLAQLLSFNDGNIVQLCVIPPSGTVQYNKVRFSVSVPVGVNVSLSFSVYNAFANAAGDCNIRGLLPVTLQKFTAEAGKDCSFLLKWSTALEQNSSHFELLRNNNGSTAWKTITTLAAAGNSATVQAYSYVDRVPGDGNVSYRLIAKDLDGKSEILQSTPVNAACGGNVASVFPSIITDGAFTIKVPGNVANFQVRLINSAGKEQHIQLAKREHEIKVTTGSLASGMYLVQFGATAVVETHKVFVP